MKNTKILLSLGKILYTIKNNRAAEDLFSLEKTMDLQWKLYAFAYNFIDR